MKNISRSATLLALITLGSWTLWSLPSRAVATGEDLQAEYDRLDGMGTSGKKVQVIEWEGNLEVHVYPAGSLKSLALKLDSSSAGGPSGQKKSVMVLGYRFKSAPQVQIVRRAILGIQLSEGFKAYQDPETTEYDKYIITQQGLAAPLALVQLEPGPAQSYPDGDSRVPASLGNPAKKGAPEQRPETPQKDSIDHESGTIQPFMTRDREIFGRNR